MATKEKQYKLAVLIGRFQGFHKMHEELVREADGLADDVLMLVGSAFCARDIKNPFRYVERCEMIRRVFPKVHFAPVEDYDDDDHWIAAVQKQVEIVKAQLGITNDKEIILVGHNKDASSFYLELFPHWERHRSQGYRPMDATTIRDMIFSMDMRGPNTQFYLKEYLSDQVIEFMDGWFRTPAYPELCHEYEKNLAYKKAWEPAPYKPIFVTVDAVVTCAGHVLMVRRKYTPGKGLLALPGGFLEPGERIRDGIIRELKEETGINLGKGTLKSSMGAPVVFDKPGRSLRGRTITHAARIDLPYGKPPEVKGADDAEGENGQNGAMWVPYHKFMSLKESIFEDHKQIVQALTGISM